MTETDLWNRYTAARVAYIESPTEASERALMEAFSAFAIEFIEDPVARNEEIERLRHNLIAARVAA